MNTPEHGTLEVVQVREQAAHLKDELETHRSQPKSTPEWREHEKDLLEQLSTTEGRVARLTAEQGIIDA